MCAYRVSVCVRACASICVVLHTLGSAGGWTSGGRPRLPAPPLATPPGRPPPAGARRTCLLLLPLRLLDMKSCSIHRPVELPHPTSSTKPDTCVMVRSMRHQTQQTTQAHTHAQQTTQTHTLREECDPGLHRPAAGGRGAWSGPARRSTLRNRARTAA